MENLILNSIQEIFLFDLVEMLFLLLFYLAETKKKITKIQFIYNLGIMTMLDFIISAFNLPVIMQIIFILIVAIYLKKFFQITFKRNIIIVVKYFALMLFDILYVMMFKEIYNVQIFSMPLNALRFLYLLPCKTLEGLIIYKYYKGGELFMKKDKKLVWAGSIAKRKLQK